MTEERYVSRYGIDLPDMKGKSPVEVIGPRHFKFMCGKEIEYSAAKVGSFTAMIKRCDKHIDYCKECQEEIK